MNSADSSSHATDFFQVCTPVHVCPSELTVSVGPISMTTLCYREHSLLCKSQKETSERRPVEKFAKARPAFGTSKSTVLVPAGPDNRFNQTQLSRILTKVPVSEESTRKRKGARAASLSVSLRSLTGSRERRWTDTGRQSRNLGVLDAGGVAAAAAAAASITRLDVVCLGQRPRGWRTGV